jgi:cephalosporin hydroxylase
VNDARSKDQVHQTRIANDVDVIRAMQADPELRRLRQQMYALYAKYRYSYNFTWYGRPIIQIPEDIVMMQELILQVKPDLIVETGVAHGGSLMLSASMLELLGAGNVVGIDIEIRSHNRKAIEDHPLSKRIRLIEGSSVDEKVMREVERLAASAKRVMVLLDSNHTHEHVLQELQNYAPLVTPQSYLVVFDTGIEDMPEGTFAGRPWGKGNNPKTAVRQFLRERDDFIVATEIEDRMMYTVAPHGYLRRVR